MKNTQFYRKSLIIKKSVIILLCYFLINCAEAVDAFLYIAAPTPQAAQDIINNAFDYGLTPVRPSSGANSVADFWNWLRAPANNPSFFRVFISQNDLIQHLDPSNPNINGVIFTISLNSNFYFLPLTIINFSNTLTVLSDPTNAIRIAVDSTNNFSEYPAQFIMGFNNERITNNIIRNAQIYQNGVRIGSPQSNQGYHAPTDIANSGFLFNPDVEQPLNISEVQVLPPIEPSVFERFLSFFACGSDSSTTVVVKQDSYSCSNPKIETVQQYNINYAGSLNSLRISPNGTVYALENPFVAGLVRIVPDPSNNKNMLIIPYYIKSEL